MRECVNMFPLCVRPPRCRPLHRRRGTVARTGGAPHRGSRAPRPAARYESGSGSSSSSSSSGGGGGGGHRSAGDHVPWGIVMLWICVPQLALPLFDISNILWNPLVEKLQPKEPKGIQGCIFVVYLGSENLGRTMYKSDDNKNKDGNKKCCP